jgi:beta-ureidopropionase
MTRVVRVALTETRNAFADMPASMDALEALAPRLDELRAANVEHHVDLARQAAAAGAQLIGFGELFTGPYFALETRAFWRELAEDARDGPTTTRLREVARELGIVIVAPLYELDDASGKRFNTAVVIERTGEVLGIFRKVHIPAGRNEQGEFHETFYYEGSDGALRNGPANISKNDYYPVFETSVGRIGIAICYDRHFPVSVAALAANGAQIVLQPSVTFGATSQRMWPLEAQVDALRHRVYVCPSNRRGPEKPWGIEYFGRSGCFGPSGPLEARDAGPGLRIFDLDLDALTAGDSGWDLARDARPQCER